MNPFGKVIPPTGIPAQHSEPVWSSEVQIHKITEKGQVTYCVCYLKTVGSNEIGKAIDAALTTVAMELTANETPEG